MTPFVIRLGRVRVTVGMKLRDMVVFVLEQMFECFYKGVPQQLVVLLLYKQACALVE